MQESRRRTGKSRGFKAPEHQHLAGGSSKRGAGGPLGVRIWIVSLGSCNSGLKAKQAEERKKMMMERRSLKRACHLLHVLLVREAPLKCQ